MWLLCQYSTFGLGFVFEEQEELPWGFGVVTLKGGAIFFMTKVSELITERFPSDTIEEGCATEPSPDQTWSVM